MVIHLNRMLFSEQEIDIDGDEEGVASIAVDGKNLVLLPGRLMEDSGDPAAVGRAIGDIFQSLELIDSEEFDGLMEQIAVSVETTFEQIASAAEEAAEAQDLERRHVERQVAAQQLASRKMAVAFAQATEEMARALEEAASEEGAAGEDAPEPSAAQTASSSSSVVFGREAAVRALDYARRRMPRLKIEGELGADIEQDGETIGRVRAQVNEAEVLRSVLSRTRRDQGEIAFALGQDGTIFTPDPQDQEQLEQLQLAGLVADGGRGGDGSSARLQGNWVIVTRQVPDQELVFGIARPVGESLDEIRSTARQNMGWGLALVCVAMLGIIPLSGRMTRNLSRLTDGATQMAGGNLDVRVPVRSSDEIGQLAQAFNNMGASLEQHQRQRVEQERLQKELEMCRQIQDEMLPQGASRLPFGEVRALSIPAREVGGDFFNYFTLDDGDVALLMGDVSGKGVPAALMMANLQATLRARLPHEPNLATLAERLDGEIEGGTRSKDYVTLFMGVIDPSRMVLRYVNAGHNTQYVLGEGGRVEPLTSVGRPLGLLSGGGYREQEVQLKPGDFVFLFTDGLVEAENEAGQPFGEERLAELLRRERQHAAAGVLERVERALADYRGQAEAADDATMMVVHLGA